MAQEYKLKGLASLADVTSFDKIECEVEGVPDGKVLVVKYDGHVHAISPRCTHYGAPLKLGVVVPDGRITCPWHGGTCYPLILYCLGIAVGGGMPEWRDRDKMVVYKH